MLNYVRKFDNKSTAILARDYAARQVSDGILPRFQALGKNLRTLLRKKHIL
jgi:hypothetical protein